MSFPIYDVEDMDVSALVLVSSGIPDLNLQLDDVGKTMELECTVEVKQVTSFLINGQSPSHQYVLEVTGISKLQEEGS